MSCIAIVVLLLLLTLLLWIESDGNSEFNQTQLEIAARLKWGPGSNFYRRNYHYHYHHLRATGSNKPGERHRSRRSLRAEKLPSFDSDINQLNFTRLNSTLNVAFYNIYADGDLFREIVSEQRHALRLSNAYDVLDTVFYTTISPSIKSNFIIENDTKYDHLYHFNYTCYEHCTLGLMQLFCQDYPQAHVLYFHDKGSYHPRSTNKQMRQVLDCYVLHPRCLAALQTGEYDTCSFRASPLPLPHYPGNFFWAKCEYVNTLIKAWDQSTNETMQRINDEILPGCLSTNGRLFSEMWILSGLNYRPADCVDASVDDTYFHGYEIPESISTNCPKLFEPGTSIRRAKKQMQHKVECKFASTWTDGDKFRKALTSYTVRLEDICNGDVYSTIQLSSRLWYGRDSTAYESWMKGNFDAVRQNVTIASQNYTGHKPRNAHHISTRSAEHTITNNYHHNITNANHSINPFHL